MQIGFKRKATGILAGFMLAAAAGTGCSAVPGTPGASASGQPPLSVSPESSASATSGTETASSDGSAGTDGTTRAAGNASQRPTEEPVVVLLSADGDVNLDGFSEHAALERTEAGILRLTVSAVADSGFKPVSREVAGSGAGSDFQNVDKVSAMQIVRIFSDTDEFPVIALSFEDSSINDTQLCIYSFSPTEGLVLEKTEPYAVDTGIVSLTDADGDGLHEKFVDKDHVSMRYRYLREGSQLTAEFLDAEGKVAFDLTKPEEVIRSWMFNKFNGIEDGMNDILVPGTIEPRKVFIPYESSSGAYLGITFADATRDMYMGMPSGQITAIRQDDDSAVYRISDVSDFSEREAAAIRFQLVRESGAAWRISGIERETAVPVCMAEDRDNVMVLEYYPVFLSAQDMKDGYGPVRTKLKELTGIVINTLSIDGERCTADLASGMDNYMNQGSTGAKMRIESLVRTLLALPGVMEAEIRIAGRERVEMDHYSLDGIFSLTDDGLLRLDPWTALEVFPAESLALAQRVLQALHDRDLLTLARLVDPDTGLRLSIRHHVTALDPVLDRTAVLSYQYDMDKDVFFEAEDGTGGIRGTKQQLFSRFYAVSHIPEQCRIISLPADASAWMNDDGEPVAVVEPEDADTTSSESDEPDIKNADPRKAWADVPEAEQAETVYADCSLFLIALYDGDPMKTAPVRTLKIALRSAGDAYSLAGIVSDDP